MPAVSQGRTGPSAGDSGMTLVEMLVVLAIVGITAMIAVLSLGSDRALNTRAAAKRMQAQIQFAADQSMISDRQMAITLGEHSYRFVERASPVSDWEPSQDSRLSEEFGMPAGMTLRADRGPIPIGANGAGRPFIIRLQGEGSRWIIAFDGMTARVFPVDASASAPLAATP